MDLKEEDILKGKIEDHWYYISKGRALLHFLGDIRANEILDIGAGSGIFSRQLLDEGICQSAVCLDTNYLKEGFCKHNGKGINFVKEIESISQELILMMDVLEHVKEDLGFLSYYTERMNDNGTILITVPAFNFLYSPHDLFLEHYRRYTISSIETLIKQSGMTPIKSRYFFAPLFPAIATLRILKGHLCSEKVLKPRSELKIYPNWINKLLTNIHNVERNIFFDFNKFFGLSIFCLSKKL